MKTERTIGFKWEHEGQQYGFWFYLPDFVPPDAKVINQAVTCGPGPAIADRTPPEHLKLIEGQSPQSFYKLVETPNPSNKETNANP